MKDDFVKYNGVMMAKEWQGTIEEAQKKKQYKINNNLIDRVPYGNESWQDEESKKYPCHDCSVLKYQYHVPCCDVEECPICREQAISCECNYEEDIKAI